MEKVHHELLADPEALERDHVQRAYDSIVASKVTDSRFNPWPCVEAFVRSHPKGTLFGDVGTGTGKNIPIITSTGGLAMGWDFSHVSSQACRRTGFDVATGNALCVPFRDAAFDSVLCVAVLHHIASTPRRIEVILEAVRVLKVGGDVLFHVWAADSLSSDGAVVHNPDNKAGGTQDVFVHWTSRGTGGGGGAIGDSKPRSLAGGEISVEATSSQRAVGGDEPTMRKRYCHLFHLQELRELFNVVSPWLKVESITYDSGNWAVIARKIAEHKGIFEQQQEESDSSSMSDGRFRGRSVSSSMSSSVSDTRLRAISTFSDAGEFARVANMDH